MKQHNHKQSFREYVVVEYHECLCTNRVDSKYFPAKISLTKTSSSLLFDYEIFEKKKNSKIFGWQPKTCATDFISNSIYSAYLPPSNVHSFIYMNFSIIKTNMEN